MPIPARARACAGPRPDGRERRNLSLEMLRRADGSPLAGGVDLEVQSSGLPPLHSVVGVNRVKDVQYDSMTTSLYLNDAIHLNRICISRSRFFSNVPSR